MGKDIFWQKWADAWFTFFAERNDGLIPNFNGPQAKHLKNLRAYLTKAALLKTPEKDPDQAGYEAFLYILKNWDRLEPWYHNKADLAIMYSKINDILTQLRSKANEKRNTSLSGALAAKINGWQ